MAFFGQNMGAPAPQLFYANPNTGELGVNFAGFHAGVGLNGLLNGQGGLGGMYAQAGTPFGQFAGAGMGGGFGPDNVFGNMFAGAQGLPGFATGANMGGMMNPTQAFGYANTYPQYY